MSMNGYDTNTWNRLYEENSELSSVYQQIQTCQSIFVEYQAKDNFLYMLGQVCVPLCGHR